MNKGTRRRSSPEYKEQFVARLSEPGATLGGVAAELGITPTQLNTWRHELEAAGSATAIATQKAAAAELTELRRENKLLTGCGNRHSWHAVNAEWWPRWRSRWPAIVPSGLCTACPRQGRRTVGDAR